MPDYLALGALQPGDVILSAARTLRSTLIRFGTGSLTASHAAIAINPLIWFESVGLGVRYQFIRPELVWDGHDVRLAMALPQGERFSVRRPLIPLFDTASAHDRHAVAKQLIAASSRFVFLNYPPPSAFLATLRLSLGDSAFARFAATVLDRRQKVFHPGPFCSWLVAECYRDLGRDGLGQRPESVTPAALARSKALVTVDARVTGEPLPEAPGTGVYRRELNVAVEKGATVVDGLWEAAAFTKRLTTLNDGIGKFTSLGWALAGMKLPRQDATMFDGIATRQLAQLADWQARSISALENAYASISGFSEQAKKLEPCRLHCAVSPDECRVWGCPAVNAGFQQSTGEINAVFPPPDIDALIAEHKRQRAARTAAGK